MFTEKTLQNLARLSLKTGVNLQPDQGLEILCPVELKEIARAITVEAYKMGAKIVQVNWSDDIITKINYENASTSVLCQTPKWFVERKNQLVKDNFCYIAIDAEDPTLLKDIPAEKLSAVSKARSKALKKYYEEVMGNKIRWCVISAPTLSWAKQVFPSSLEPEQDLQKAIEFSMRLNEVDVESAWNTHIKELERHAKFLNDKNFEYLHFESSNGTDLKVGLAIDHVWMSAEEKAKDGIYFVANLPTEEVFTCPHRLKVDGIVKSALPLSFNGQLIEDFSLTFKKGKVVDFSAEKGFDVLREILNMDKGISHIGEVALIGKNSPIAQSGILFYNTLFDENASCHLALGKAYPTTVKNGNGLTTAQLKEKGVNDSIDHIDFMIGSKDMKITGIGFDKSITLLFDDGEWVI